jgi:ACS family pantothenate transporter-like MFS transporter
MTSPDEKQYLEQEKAYVRRLDKRLLAFAMFGNMVKALDNSNLGKNERRRVDK